MSKLSERFHRMFGLRRVYRRAFLGPNGRPSPELIAVMADLERFCRAHTSTVVVSPITRQVDTHATMLAEGRREVFNRIKQYINLTDEQLQALKDSTDET